MINEEFQNKQKERLVEVIEYLKSIDITQKQICNATDISEQDLSHYKKKDGKIKVIPNKFLEKLEETYSINIEFIRGTSKYMLNTRMLGFEHFEKFVDDWTTVKRKDNQYLYIEMEENFYNYLIDLDTLRKIEDMNQLKLEDEIKNLGKKYESDSVVREYVVLPKNNFIEIVQEYMEVEKTFNSLVSLSEYKDVLEENVEAEESSKNGKTNKCKNRF